jgi:hypothetical protein
MSWFESRRMRRVASTSGAARLITDTEEFFAGTYAEHLRRHHEQVPGWARLNTLAHGELSDVRFLRRSLAARKAAAFADWHEETWRKAERTLAGEVLEIVRSDADTLARVQRRILVPLELALMNSEAAGGLSVAQLLDSTRSALRSSIS